MTGRARRHGTALLLFGVLALAFVHPALRGRILSSFPGSVVSTDPAYSGAGYGVILVHNPLLYDPEHVFKPDLLEARRQLGAGHLPLWQAEQGTGRPLLASQQFAPFFPTTVPQLIAPDRLAALSLALKLFLAALGAYAFACRLRMARAPALLTGAVYGFSPYFVAWAQHPQTDVWLMLPWSLIAAGALARRPGPAPALAFGATGGLELLGGHPQSVFLQAPLTVAWLVREQRQAGTAAWRVASWGLAAAAWALVLGAVMVLPFAAALTDTYAADRGVAPAPLGAIWAIVQPDLWGLPTSPAVLGPLNFAERTIFVGALPLMLAVLAAVRRRPPARFFLLTGLAAALCVYDNPVARTVRHLPVVPAVNVLRLQVLIVFSLAVLAGLGLQCLLTAPPRQRGRALLLAVIVALLPLLALADGATAATLARWLVPAALALAVIARPIPAAAVALTVAGVAWIGIDYHQFTAPAEAHPPVPPLIRAAARVAGKDRVAGQGTAFKPSQAARYGVTDALVHDHPPVGRYGQLSMFLGAQSAVQPILPAEPALARRLLVLTSVGAVIVPSDERPPAGSVRRAAVPGAQVLAVPGHLPRAFLAGAITPAPDREAALYRAIHGPEQQLRSAPVVEGLHAPVSAAASRGSAVLTRDDGGTVRIRTRSAAPGVLVLTDAYSPGWHAAVDGRPAAIRPANFAFRAVPVPAGAHTVTMTYRPLPALIGIWLSALGWLLTLIAALAAARRSAPAGRSGAQPRERRRRARRRPAPL